MTKNDCEVCTMPFTSCKRKLVSCPCEYKVCTKCTKTYLLGSSHNPHCMNCRRAWTRDFMCETVGRAFVNGIYTNKRKEILFEKEKARMPETLPLAEILKKREASKIKVHEAQKEVVKCLQLWREARYKLREEEIQLDEYRDIFRSGKVNKKVESYMKCPVDNCKGFLENGTNKCKICTSTICKKCISVVSDENHECKKEDLETAKLIQSTTKPCPQCGTRISKVNGCDQMWCTNCHVAFSWNTGKMETGIVHNPHYYQWMNNNDVQHANRNPQDEVCGGLINYHHINTHCRQNKININLDRRYNLLSIMHRGIRHLQIVIIRKLREDLNGENDNSKRRAEYMCDMISESEFISHIIKKDKNRMRDQDMLNVYELYVQVGIEQFRNLLESHFDDGTLLHLLKTMEKLRDYCVDELKKISRNYKMGVWLIEENFDISNNKIKW